MTADMYARTAAARRTGPYRGVEARAEAVVHPGAHVGVEAHARIGARVRAEAMSAGVPA